MAEGIRLPKGKVLRTKHDQAAAQIFAQMPKGCARREGNEVIVMAPVVMTFASAPDPAPALPKPDTNRPFIFDQPKHHRSR